MRYVMIGATFLAILATGIYYMHTESTPASTPKPANEFHDHETATESPKEAVTEDAQSVIATKYGLTEKELKRQTRQRTYKRAAEARFKQAVKMDGLRPDDVAPGVRTLFETMKLEPVIDAENTRKGSVSGMRISRLSSNNPLADAGFMRGDRLTRINGMALNDPAQIAHLFTRIDNRMEVCLERAGKEYCQNITL